MSDVDSLISLIGLPAGAIVFAGGMVRGAKALEKGARLEALEYVAGLLTEGNLRNLGNAGPGLIPFIFDRIFGPNPDFLRKMPG